MKGVRGQLVGMGRKILVPTRYEKYPACAYAGPEYDMRYN